MMTLITGVSVIIYSYSTGYMYQDRHARRYLAMICLTDFVLICMVSSANLMMLFLFWQVLSYLLYVLAHNHAHGDAGGSVQDLYASCAWPIRPFSPASHSRITCTARSNSRSCFSEPPTCRSVVPLAGHGHERRDGRHAAALRRSDGNRPSFRFISGSRDRCSLPLRALHAGIINAGGFLINRLAPLFGLSSTTLHVAFLIGTPDRRPGASMMLAQNDIKKRSGSPRSAKWGT